MVRFCTFCGSSGDNGAFSSSRWADSSPTFPVFVLFFALFSFFLWVGETDDIRNAMLQKKMNFEDTRHKISVPLAMTTNLQKKSSKLFQKTKKKILGRCWTKIGLRKTQPKVNSERRDSESWTDSDRQYHRLRHEISTVHARQGLRPTLWSQCPRNGR